MFECCGEHHVQISEDLTLIMFDGEDYFDLDQIDTGNSRGFQSITITKDELIEILSHIEKYQGSK